MTDARQPENSGPHKPDDWRSCQTSQECFATHHYAGHQTNYLRRYRDVARGMRDEGAVINSKWAKVPLEQFNDLLAILKAEEVEDMNLEGIA